MTGFCLSRAFVLRQLISVLKRWTGCLICRRRNIVVPINNVSTVATVADSTATSPAEQPLQLDASALLIMSETGDICTTHFGVATNIGAN